MSDTIISTEPATGAEVWRGEPGDSALEVAAARAAWPEWAARSISYRMEALRRFANLPKDFDADDGEITRTRPPDPT